jgi:hypothetical protein
VKQPVWLGLLAATVLIAVVVAILQWPRLSPTHRPGAAKQEFRVPASGPAPVSPDTAGDAEIQGNSRVSPGASAVQSGPVVSTLSTPGKATPPELTSIDPATVLENMQLAFRQFRAQFGANPVGTNPEITRALSGANPKQIDFISADDGLRVNDKGELIDAWGSPFFFHQLAADEMEVHSAGPDRKMWTGDDLVVK